MTNVQLRTLLKDSLTAGLTLQEYRAFVAVLIKTVGYGKDSDDIATSQLTDLTGVRGDKIRPASKALADKGLFNREKGKYGFVFTLSEQYRDNSIRFDVEAAKAEKSTKKTTHEHDIAEAALQFPDALSESEETKALKDLLPFSHDRKQAILDALDTRIKQGGVRSNLAMLKSMVTAEENGCLIETPKEKPRRAVAAKEEDSRREDIAELHGLNQLAKLGGVPLETFYKTNTANQEIRQ